MKPIIGIIPLWDSKRNSIWMIPGYMDIIREAGGVGIILPLKVSDCDLEQLCELCDGFLFTGGEDVNPAIYGEQRSELCGESNEERDSLEGRIFHYAVDQDLPVLGICRGIQFINALCGGSLYQDLPSEYTPTNRVSHQMKPPYDRVCHRVTILSDTPLSALTNESEIGVNSYHHQAIKALAPTLKSMAISEDGLIEAIYMPNKRFIEAVQWHPELNFHNDTLSRKIVESFIEACRR